jgi:hypothetical protein
MASRRSWVRIPSAPPNLPHVFRIHPSIFDLDEGRSLVKRSRANCAEVRQEGAVQARQRAAAKDYGADGTRGLLIGDAHVAALRVFLDGHLRNDGDPHSRADHAENAAELSTLEDNLRVEARAVAGGHGRVPEAVAVAQEEKWLFAKVL